ncbi:hypothetical protein H2508_00810 [Parahaliea sp. F7430]|uniref:FHA domain-containing protein n=1 Tax=Sediminihaliea albiluteola TaxID=2758564 RepID=A0A7W2TTG7_9GAMM|nr:hypothetical protein [Sediminihaliea albiluteola]MBA6411660.1 hypothetical protein [Sediminihaliea albiluteola]
MSTALLDINDSNLQLWRGDTHLQSPGYALLDGRNYQFGHSARAAARLRPREVTTRYWWQLSTQPLQPALGPARHSADLVHAHLLQLHREAGQPESLILTVPDSMEREQLALLLGIIETCPFDAVGLVNRSVALAQHLPSGDPVFHLEFQLHQALLTELQEENGQRRLLRSQPLAGCGVLQLQERLIELIATAFIRQTRFDPRRKADTEQQLYNALPTALADLQRSGESNIEINGYSARLNAAALQEASQSLFTGIRDIVGSGGYRLIADPLAGLLPGIHSALPSLAVLASNQLAKARPLLENELPKGDAALALLKALPYSSTATQSSALEPSAAQVAIVEPETEAPRQTAPPRSKGPSHLLQGYNARPLRAEGTPLSGGWELYLDQQQWLLRGPNDSAATVNGQVYSTGRGIHCGDTLAIAGVVAGVLIEVEDTE